VDLPDGYGERRPSLADLGAIHTLTVACDVPVLGYGDWNSDEIREVLTDVRSLAATHHRLVVDADDRIVGWGLTADRPGGSVDVDWFVDPALHPETHRSITDALVASLFADLDARAWAAGAKVVRVDAGAYRPDVRRAGEHHRRPALVARPRRRA